MRLENKKTLVTGASRGIGKAIYNRFLAGGADVWGIGTKEPEGLAERVKAANDRFHRVSADLSALDGLEVIIESLLSGTGGLIFPPTSFVTGRDIFIFYLFLFIFYLNKRDDECLT
jgi:NAD(P)-dependent dehydrogenase (short-subunit alcohol dehydrogenase family)